MDENNNVIAQTDGTDTLRFVYDSNGAPIYMEYNGTVYYYEKNLQGDIVGILDTSGTTVVQYSYDIWGKLLGINGELADTVGTANPLRYRGYYYDTETELYYLQSRYYSPELMRFISMDDAALSNAQGEPIGSNLYAYCLNNPVNGQDPTGKAWISYAGVALICVQAVYYTVNWIHRFYNQKLKTEGYIYNQQSGNAAKYWYGFFRSSHNGCGWIAAYNALIMLGNHKQPADIITCFERSGALVWGAIGTNPLSIAKYFVFLGYSVTISVNPSKFDTQAKKNTANILFYCHSQGAHNIALRWSGFSFVGYNVYSNSSGLDNLGRSISSFLKDKKYAPAILISISRR